MDASTRTRVAVIRADRYPDLDSAVAEALKLAGAGSIVGKGDRMLLKPNLLMKSINACTAADFVAAVARALKQYGGGMSLGDSPGQMGKTARDIMKHAKIDEVMERENISYVEFESATVKVHNGSGRHMRDYHMTRAVHDADVIVNLPRPKSHVEAAYTGAVKNFWGIIPGGEKAQCHLYGKDPAAFGNVIVDNYQAMKALNKKNLVIMDARVIMEGLSGPAAGTLREAGLIIAGTDDVAVDAVMLAIGGRDACREVPHLRACRDRGVGVTDLGSIDIVGESLESVRLKKKFNITSQAMTRMATFFTGAFVYKMARRMPLLKKNECTMCGDCFKICPAKAITWEKKSRPSTDYNQCISCLCCVECCPQHAIRARMILLRGLFLREPTIRLPHAE